MVPASLIKHDVICLDSSGEEEEKEEPKLPALAIKDGKVDPYLLNTLCFSLFAERYTVAKLETSQIEIIFILIWHSFSLT